MAPGVRYPTNTNELHHEAELVTMIEVAGRNLALNEAEAAIFGYAVGLDFMRRDRPTEAQGKGRPWAISTNFYDAVAKGVVSPKLDTGLMKSGTITLDINDVLRQTGNVN